MYRGELKDTPLIFFKLSFFLRTENLLSVFGFTLLGRTILDALTDPPTPSPGVMFD
jgi:hypothetical protein